MDLERRATTFAALADPTRLRIADLLGDGDASPAELRAATGLASNLLAHHLAVLEEAGVVSRHRSHGDRRRTYLHLDPDSLVGLLPAPARPTEDVERVVFVCTANSARSQLANALWQQTSGLPSTSAGTHPASAIAPGALGVARRRGLRLVQTQPRSLDGLLRSGDLVVTVCDSAHEELTATALDAASSSTHWSVPDPVADGTATAFDLAYDDLADRVSRLATRLDAS